jgi:autotransporter-associated beta strand protein
MKPHLTPSYLSSNRLPGLAAGVLWLCTLTLTQGAVRTWSGGGADGQWQTGGNWLGGTPPSSGDILIFTNTVRVANTNNFVSGTLFNGLSFSSPAGAFNLWGKPLSLGGGITNSQVVTPETITNLAITLTTTPTISVVPNGSLILGTVISGAGFGLTKQDGGAVTLASPNTFSGPVTINGGSVLVSSDANLGAVPGSATPGNIVLSGNGATLHTTTTLTINSNRGIALGPQAAGSDSGRLSVDSGTTLTYRGILANNGAGTGGLTKGGPGTLVLSAPGTYTGPTSNRVGNLTLDFTQTTSPVSNIISRNSSLSIGGENTGIGTVNNIQVLMTGKTSTTNSQTFNGTFFDLGGSVVQATSGAGGGANLLLGGVNHIPGAGVSFFTPANGRINTASPVINGILGGWALIGNPATAAVNGIIPCTNWATVDVNGNIVPATSFFIYASGNLAGQVTAQTNLLFGTAPAGAVMVDVDHSTPPGSVTDVNSIILGGTSAYTLTIGSNNVLRLGRYGGIFVTNIFSTANNNFELGDGVASGSTTGSTAHQNSGTLTAGGAPNTPGELVFTINSSSQTANGSVYVETAVTDNGSGAVSVIKTGAGPMKLRGHNTFSGGMYILQGRIQMAGAELPGGATMTANPDGFGTGPIYVLPGGQAFPSGAGGNASMPAMTNNWFIAGNGVSDNVGAIRLSGIFSNGIITLIGDARLGGGGFNVSSASVVPIYDQIRGPFNLDIGATGNSGGGANGAVLFNQANNWSGNTTIVGRTGAAGNTMVHNGANDVIPDGFGMGNMQFGNSGNTASLTAWNLNGFNETINGLVSVTTSYTNQFITNTVTGTTSTLTLGNNDQSGTFGGAIAGNIALVKIGGGTETLVGTNTYTGATVVNVGTLAIAGIGSISNTPVQVNPGATLDVSGSTLGFSTPNSIGVNGGTFSGNTASAGISSFNLTNAALQLSVNPTVTNIFATSLNTGAGNNLLNIISVLGIRGYPTQFTIIKYTGTIGGAGYNFNIGSVPSPSTQGYLSNDTANAQVVLVLTNGPKPLTWTGLAGSAWDVGFTTNWLAFGLTPSVFFNADSVQFDDTASSGSVALTNGVIPAALVVTNNSLSYNFSGSASIGGPVNLVKQGSGSLTLAETGSDSFSGGITVNGGLLTLAADNGISGGLSLDSGTTAQIGAGAGTGNLPAGNVACDGSLVFNRGADLTVNGVISGAGSLTKNDAAVLTLNGANTFTGAVLVTQGTLRAGSGAALGTADSGTTISSGATLDLNGQSLGAEVITVSGAGVGANGAIINSGADQINALRSVTLAGSTTFGGLGRWDIRLAGGLGALNTGGAGYNITKVGPNQFSLVGVTVDGALGNINVQSGLFSVETTTSGLGNAANSVTVSAGATLQLYNLANQIDKVVVLNGDGITATVNAGNGTANIINSTAGSMSLNGSCIFNAAGGAALTIISPMNGSGSLTTTGPGTNIFSQGVSYSGPTTVNAGVLLVDGSKTGGGLTVQPGAILGGNGSINEPVTLTNAVLSPGDPSISSAGTLTLQSGLVLNNTTNVFELSPIPSSGNDLVAVTGNLALIGINALKIVPLQYLEVSSNYTLFTYSGTLVGDASNLQVLAPNGYSFHVVDPTTTPGSIQIVVDGALGNDIWVGGALGSPTLWDNAVTLNWSKNGHSSVFTNGDFASFDDTALTNLVTVAGTLLPSGISFSNFTGDFTLSGAGSLSGSGFLDMDGGTGRQLTIANSGTNDFTGYITIGPSLFFPTLQVGNGGTAGNLGSGNITNQGQLVFNRSGSLTVSNRIFGPDFANITNMGSGVVTLAGANAFTGMVTLVQGTLRLLNSTALGSTNGQTTVNSGATLDLGANAVNIGLEPVTVSGAGVGGNGALINSSGSATFVGANIANITLAGDTVFGGSGRLDFRANPINSNNAVLVTSGQPYKLTKVGTNQLQIGGVVIDASLGDIEVQSGLLGLQTLSGLGNAASNLTVFGNATLGLFDLTNATTFKTMVLNDGAVVSSTSGNNLFGGPVTLQGSNAFNITAGSLSLTNTLTAGGGTLVKQGANALFLYSIPAENTFDVQAGTLDVTSAGTALSLSSGQRIRGSGTLSGGLNAGAGSTVAPGEANATGTLTVNNGTATLAGSTVMKLNRAGNPTNDQLHCATGLALGGTLTVTNIGATLRSGDTFLLFNSGALSGSISPVSLPPLWPGLSWNTGNLNSLGSIAVQGTLLPPAITSSGVSGGNFFLTGSGGVAGATYYVLSTTNVAQPLANWTRAATNVFDVSGGFSYTNSLADQQRFFRISAP